MQKAYNIISPIIIVGLGVWIFFLIRANMQWKDLLAKKVVTPPATPPVTETPAPTTATTNTPPERTSISGNDLWNQFKGAAKEVKVDLTF